MKVKVVLTGVMCGPNGNGFRGTVLDLPEDEAKDMVERKFARPYDHDKDRKAKQIGLAKAPERQ